ncbi:MAG: glycosyltransferase family 2 protein [Acidobacteria bacterium]|nr:glycosyltransferase family 2 protein [Acidobacteriota bacterium]
MATPYLSIVIPAYNEASRMGEALEGVRRYVASRPFVTELILVDDGSSDSTPDLFRQLQSLWPHTRILQNEVNRGKGFSVRRGMLEAHGDVILFTDADLSAPIEETDKLLAAMESSSSDAAVGSRALDRKLIGIHQPWTREFAGRCFNFFVRLLTGLNIRDTQCGFKLFRRATTRRAFELQRVERFGFDPEVLFLIHRMGGKIVEVPVRWNDNPATKVHFLRDSIRMFFDLLALRWRSWRHQYFA